MDYRYVSKIINGLSIHDDDLFNKIKDFTKLKKEEVDSLCKKTSLFICRLKDVGIIKNKHKKNLCVLIFKGFLCGEIKIISINSHALLKNSKDLRDKDQYRKNCKLSIFLKKLQKEFDVKINYTSILADLDKNFDLYEYKKIWDLNKEYLKRESKIETIRLSELMKKEDFELYRSEDEVINIKGLRGSIEKYNKSQDIKVDFNAPENFIKNQILSYVVVGMILEKRLPDVILLDVQRKYYPFEQPFYNFNREFKIPIVYSGY